MANDRFNVRIDGGLLARLLIDLLGGTATFSVQGIDADDAPATANPVLVGGKYIAAPTTDPLDPGDAGYALLDIYRRLLVAGGDVDSAAATANPILIGGKYILDPAAVPLADGDAGYALLDDQRRLVVSIGGGGGASISVEGIDADDDPATANPVLIGGKYILDPSADLLDDGDAGYALLNDRRMLVVESSTYDAPTDADKNVPVWSVADRWDTEDLSSSAVGAGTVTKYVSMDGYIRWSLQFIPAGANVDISIWQSNEDVDDPTTATYTDVTNYYFGVATFAATAWIEPELPVSTKWLRVDAVTTGADSWDLFLRKLAQG